MLSCPIIDHLFGSEQMDEELPGPDPLFQSVTILKMLSDAEPDGMDGDELRKAAEAMGISAIDLDHVLKSLMTYANIYFNASKGRYHHMWSSSIQYE
jgi:hypothetical protein